MRKLLRKIKSFFGWVAKDVEKGDLKSAEQKIRDEVKETIKEAEQELK